VLTRVTVMAVYETPTGDLLVLVVWRQTSSIELAWLVKKTPVVASVKVRGVPAWSFFASGVTLPPAMFCIQQDALPVPAMVAWALATKAPDEAGAIAATTVGTPGDSSLKEAWDR
jgi:hypothetical protein